MPDSAKTVVIIAGRLNDTAGAGKTTFARAFLAQSGMRFINADLIAAGLSPFEPEAFEQHYKHAVNAWVCYDNSSHKTVLLASGENP